MNASTAQLQDETRTDQTGQFSIQRSRGYKRVIVIFLEEPNVILDEAIKNASDSEFKISLMILHNSIIK